MDSTDLPKMQYRYLGNSGLKVSVIGWGNWINTKGEDFTYDVMKFATDCGVNYFDTAEYMDREKLKEQWEVL